MWKTWVQSLGWEDPLEKGKVTHSSILAWRIPWGRKEYSGLENFHGVAESQTWLSDFHFTSFTCNMFRLCPWWCTYQHFIGFYCSVTLHCKDISHFICSFIFWWTFGLCLCCCLVAELCLTPCDPMDCSQPDFSVHGVFQARKLEWVAISFSRGSSWPRDQTHISYVASTGRQILDCWATREAQANDSGGHLACFQLSTFW